MKKIILSLVLLVTIAAHAQKSSLIYDNNAAERKVGNFTAIRVSNAIDLYLTQGETNQIAVSAATDEIRDMVQTTVENGTLVIKTVDKMGWKNWNKWGNYKLKVYVSVKDLTALTAPKLNIKLSGASDLKGDIETQNMQLNVSGASNYKGQLTASTFISEASGASVVELAGNVNDLSMDVSGASSVKMYNLIAKGAIVDASGASSVNIHVTELLKVHATGASSINYKGAAVIKEMNNSGASTIKHRD
jgi:hypothetical protein